MVKLIVGKKGSGKTKRLVDELNQLAAEEKNVVCIQADDRLNQSIKYSVRLVNIEEYPVAGYDQLLSFVAGMSAKDYDLDELYIDSIIKVAKSDNLDEFTSFLLKLAEFVENKKFSATIMFSAEAEELPASIKQFII